MKLDGVFFTEEEARISADLLRATLRGARPSIINSCKCCALRAIRRAGEVCITAFGSLSTYRCAPRR